MNEITVLVSIKLVQNHLFELTLFTTECEQAFQVLRI